jgi:hypothetical protein
MAKFVVLGFKTSGKTCYLAGIHHSLCMGFNGFLLNATDFDQGERLEFLWDGIRGGRFPETTDVPEVYNFDLGYGGQYLRDICWIDYPGGIVGDTRNQFYMQLLDDLMICDGLTILIDGQHFACDYTNEQEYENFVRENMQEDKEVYKVLSKAILNRGKNGNPLTSAAIVVSKCDKIPEQVDLALVEKIIKYEFNNFFVQGSKLLSCIFFITLGDNIDKGGKVNPKRIEQPIAYMAMNAFLTDKFKLEDSSNPLSVEARAEAERNAKVAGDRVAALISAFANSKTMYVNGNKVNIKEYYHKMLDG